MKIAVLLAGILFLYCGALIAEPTPAVRFLMNEPVTLLDWGLYRLEESLRRLEKYAFYSSHLNILVRYDWDSNRIRIIGMISSNAWTLAEAKELSQRFVDHVRSALRIGNDGTIQEGSTNSLIYFFFTHYDFTIEKQPSNLASELDKIAEVEGHVFLEGKKVLNFRAALVGGEIMYWGGQ